MYLLRPADGGDAGGPEVGRRLLHGVRGHGGLRPTQGRRELRGEGRRLLGRRGRGGAGAGATKLRADGTPLVTPLTTLQQQKQQ